jgi:hypothetical protein
MEDKNLIKVLEILGKEITELQLRCELKDFEIKQLKEKLESVEDYIKNLEVENGK